MEAGSLPLEELVGAAEQISFASTAVSRIPGLDALLWMSPGDLELPGDSLGPQFSHLQRDWHGQHGPRGRQNASSPSVIVGRLLASCLNIPGDTAALCLCFIYLIWK